MYRIFLYKIQHRYTRQQTKKNPSKKKVSQSSNLREKKKKNDRPAKVSFFYE